MTPIHLPTLSQFLDTSFASVWWPGLIVDSLLMFGLALSVIVLAQIALEKWRAR